MSIEIETRGIRWRSVGRQVSIESAADRRIQVARSCYPPGLLLKPVLPKRADPLPHADASPQAAGRQATNLRAEGPRGKRSPKAGQALDAKD